MDAVELREAREEWHKKVCELAGEYRQAVFAERLVGGEGLVWAEAVGMNLDAALSQVRRIDLLLKLGVAA
jgi:hypothetical protein